MVQLLLNFFPGYPASAGAQADTKSTNNLSGNDDLSDYQNDQVNIASLLMDSSNRVFGMMIFLPLCYKQSQAEPDVSPLDYMVTYIWSLCYMPTFLAHICNGFLSSSKMHVTM